MSYTNQKVVWCSCNKGADDSVYLIDSNNLGLCDVSGKQLTCVPTISREALRYSIYGDSGESIVNSYEDISRDSGTVIKARKQPHEEVLKLENGREVLTRSYFYVDPYVEPNALSIGKMDTLDDEQVVQKYVMNDALGRPRMIRFVTI